MVSQTNCWRNINHGSRDLVTHRTTETQTMNAANADEGRKWPDLSTLLLGKKKDIQSVTLERSTYS